MNWYKIAQQMEFDFWKEPERDQYIDKRPEHLLPTPELGDMSLEETIEDAQNEKELLTILEHFADDWEFIDFPNKERIVSAIIDGNPQIITIGDEFEVEDPEKWLQNIDWSGNVYQYIDTGDFSKEFWDDVGEGFILYHGTSSDNVDDILRDGLNPRDVTRGIANRSTGSAVFTSDASETAQYSYDVVFQIDVGSMKTDEYMPEVSIEEPIQEAQWIEALAHKIGLEDYYSEVEQGLDPGTVIFYGSIPPKYLKLIY